MYYLTIFVSCENEGASVKLTLNVFLVSSLKTKGITCTQQYMVLNRLTGVYGIFHNVYGILFEYNNLRPLD